MARDLGQAFEIVDVASEEGKGSVFTFQLPIWTSEMARFDTTQFTTQTRITSPVSAPPA